MSVWDQVRTTRAVEGIERAAAAGALPHAWLFLGPRGSGKRPVAVALAAALNCGEEPGVGCGRCSSCLRTLRRRHPDVHHVVPEGPLIPVDVVREQVVPEATRSPFEGRRKIFIIEEADRMNTAAQNALLKTLEEPHEDTVFVLISERDEDILETIVSRCRVVHFEPVAEARIVELLERAGAGRDQARLAARVSDGDLERAQTFAFDDAALERRRFWLSLPRRLTSPLAALEAAGEVIAEAKEVVAQRERAQEAEVAELAEAMGEGRGTAAARNALAKRHKRELRRVEEEVLGEALTTMASYYRDVIVLRRGGGGALTNLDLYDELEAWAAGELADAALLAAVERLVTVRAGLARNANAQLALEAAFAEVAALCPPAAARHQAG
jgi:DNA polymerase-3 subunit delta'